MQQGCPLYNYYFFTFELKELMKYVYKIIRLASQPVHPSLTAHRFKSASFAFFHINFLQTPSSHCTMSVFNRAQIPYFLFTASLFIFLLCKLIPLAVASPVSVSAPRLNHMKRQAPANRKNNNNQVQYSVSESQVSFEQLVQTGLVVTKGTSGELNFNITLNAVQASTLASSDQAYQKCLSGEEWVQYRHMKRAYKNRLDVPMFENFGVHLNSETRRSDMAKRRGQQRYKCKARAMSQLLSEQITTMVQISGTLRAEGVSIMPTTVFAFIRIARVRLEDGTSMTVISSNPNDLAAANACGNEVPSSSLALDIIDLPLS